MRIVCDENVALTPALAAQASTLITMPGRQIAQRDLAEADALLVRSVTRVDASLIRNTPVRFVGTATAGVDHINQSDLQRLGVAFASAPGANANAVAEWVLGALAYSGALRVLLDGGALGIVGFGHVGQRLHRLAHRLGIQAVIYDPWVEPCDGPIFTTDLRRLLDCTAVSLHASLHDRAPWPSRDLFSTVDIPAPRHGGWLVNAGRGALLSHDTCERFYKAGWRLCLDTWPSEPSIASALLRKTQTASAHIAGYSKQAKDKATNMLVTSMLAALSSEDLGSVALPPAESDNRPATWAPEQHQDAVVWLEKLLAESSCIERDDTAMRALTGEQICPDAFDELRQRYCLRNELAGSTLLLADTSGECTQWCEALDIRWLASSGGSVR